MILLTIKSNCFSPVIPKQLQSFEKLDKRVIKCKKHVSINESKTTSLDQILGWGRFLSLRKMLSPGNGSWSEAIFIRVNTWITASQTSLALQECEWHIYLG